jgi:FkbM family methyltransferase
MRLAPAHASRAASFAFARTQDGLLAEQLWSDRFLTKPIQKHLDIFDVGANRGQSLKRFTTIYGPSRVRIVSFEPGRKTFGILGNQLRQLQAEYNNTLKAEIVNSAVSNVSSSGYLMGAGDASEGAYIDLKSDKKFNFDLPSRGEAEKVYVVDVDSMLKERGWHKLDLLKIDTEGFEMQVHTP